MSEENRLTLIRELGIKNKDGRYLGEFYCSCGKKTIAPIKRVEHGYTRSCGCLNNGEKNKTHGMRGTKEYRAWLGIKSRVFNKISKDYSKYHLLNNDPSMLATFEAFYAEIGPCPSPDHSVDRIDNSQGYRPGNIRWATRSEQQRNRRDSAEVIIKGVRYATKSDAAKALHVTVTTVSRWQHGAFDKRRGTHTEAKEWIQVIPKYSNGLRSGKKQEQAK